MPTGRGHDQGGDREDDGRQQAGPRENEEARHEHGDTAAPPADPPLEQPDSRDHPSA